MNQHLDRQSVIALAPDAKSVKAGSQLADLAKWPLLGVDERALWGECKGSGAKPYRTQVELTSLAARCSCPSRKFPCKHALGLMLAFADDASPFTDHTAPSWVDEWLASRAQHEKKRTTKAQATRAQAHADPQAAAAAAARRDDARWNRIAAGCDELERWLADVLRHGLARFGDEQHQQAATMAARMVDAQAPGLGTRINACCSLVGGGTEEAAEAGMALGRLQLLVEAVRRRDSLPAPTMADLRNALGWSQDKTALDADAVIDDHWHVLAVDQQTGQGKLVERRVWLFGENSSRLALVQDFAHGGKAWAQHWQPGSTVKARCRFYAGSTPLRCLAEAPTVVAGSAHWEDTLPNAQTTLDAMSQAFASNPWLDDWPLLFDSATVSLCDDVWTLDTAAGTLPLQHDPTAIWSMLAQHGGCAFRAMGEWNGRSLRLLRTWPRRVGGEVTHA